MPETDDGRGVHRVDRASAVGDEALGHRDELGVAALVGLREDGVADREPGDGRADRHDLARDIPADDRPLRSPQAEGESHRSRLAAHEQHVADADGDGRDADEHLVVGGHRRVDLGERELLGAAVAVLHDRPHDAALRGCDAAGDTARGRHRDHDAAGLVPGVDPAVRLGDVVEGDDPIDRPARTPPPR